VTISRGIVRQRYGAIPHSFTMDAQSSTDFRSDLRTAVVSALCVTALAAIRFLVLSNMAGKITFPVPSLRATYAFALDTNLAVKVVEYLIIPTVIVVTARRRPIFWSLIPYGLLAIYAALISHLKQNVEIYYSSVWYELGNFAILWVATGLVGLSTRRIIRFARKRRRIASEHPDNGNVWPPPPTERL
jgi:hypothetical protein